MPAVLAVVQEAEEEEEEAAPQYHTLTSLASSRHPQSGLRRHRLCRRPCMRQPMRRAGPCKCSSSSMRRHLVSTIYSGGGDR